MADPLFDVDPAEVRPAEPVEKLSDQRRRTIRQAEAARHGQHPLGLAVRVPLRLHRDAPPTDDRKAPGPRCGGCRFRTLITYHNSTYPKCLRDWPEGDPLDRAPYVTPGTATDIRAWWPACEHWEPKP